MFPGLFSFIFVVRLLFECELLINSCLHRRVKSMCANTALQEVENPYLAQDFYMPGIWNPVLVFILR